jgi:hypothetical protein
VLAASIIRAMAAKQVVFRDFIEVILASIKTSFFGMPLLQSIDIMNKYEIEIIHIEKCNGTVVNILRYSTVCYGY